MKKTIALMTALLVMAVLFASCSNGMGEASGEGGSASTKAVKVSLSLDGDVANIAQKAVALTGGENTFTYYYQATPNWTGNTVGKTNGFEPINYPDDGHQYEDDYALGYFTPGKWTFDVQVRDSNGSNILYTGTNNNVSITNAGVNVRVPMTINSENQAKGTVKIAVAVPYISAYTKVTIALDGVAQTKGNDKATKTDGKKANALTPTTYNQIDAPGWELFTKDITPDTGNRTITLQYVDYPTVEDYNNETNGKVVGGAAVALTVLKGETYLICGTIENGKYQIVTLTLEGIDALDLSMVTTPDDGQGHNVTSIGQDGSLKFTVTDSLSDHAGTYTWQLNGADTQSANNQDAKYEYTLDTSEPGVYEVTCIVTNGQARAFVSTTVEVTPAANLVNIVTKLNSDGTGKNIKEATNGQVIYCTPVNLPNGTVEWFVNDVSQGSGDANHKISFTFAAETKIVCKVINNAGKLIGYGEKTIKVKQQNP